MRAPSWTLIPLLLGLATWPMTAAAYVGPGLGAGVIGVIIGVVGSILLAVFAIFWYPIKRMLKRRREARKPPDEQAPEEPPANRDRAAD